ncbi:hypothetical protein EK904_013356 [Melospiza melodia maxima]|nr:hypothetical protein EK904_013356 [Melospiza melodia maxima]
MGIVSSTLMSALTHITPSKLPQQKTEPSPLFPAGGRAANPKHTCPAATSIRGPQSPERTAGGRCPGHKASTSPWHRFSPEISADNDGMTAPLSSSCWEGCCAATGDVSAPFLAAAPFPSQRSPGPGSSPRDWKDLYRGSLCSCPSSVGYAGLWLVGSDRPSSLKPGALWGREGPYWEQPSQLGPWLQAQKGMRIRNIPGGSNKWSLEVALIFLLVGNKLQGPIHNLSRDLQHQAGMRLIPLDPVCALHGSSSHREQKGCGFTRLQGRDKGEARNDEGRERMWKPEELCQRRGKGECKGAMRHWPLMNFCIVGEFFNVKEDLIETRAKEEEVTHTMTFCQGQTVLSPKISQEESLWMLQDIPATTQQQQQILNLCTEQVLQADLGLLSLFFHPMSHSHLSKQHLQLWEEQQAAWLHKPEEFGVICFGGQALAPKMFPFL